MPLLGVNPKMQPVHMPGKPLDFAADMAHPELECNLVLGPFKTPWETFKDGSVGALNAAAGLRIAATGAAALGGPGVMLPAAVVAFASGVVLGRGAYPVVSVSGDTPRAGALVERLPAPPGTPSPRQTTAANLRAALSPRLRLQVSQEANKFARTLNETAFALGNLFTRLTPEQLAPTGLRRDMGGMVRFVEPFMAALVGAHFGLPPDPQNSQIPDLMPALHAWNFEPKAHCIAPLLLGKPMTPTLWPSGTLSTPTDIA